ncbi:Vesicular integral-membrane protein VIP36 [Microtus ochrogaster]|uniref:Vesicular integral-membrane protein VIP36 n=1 Tax=Microtus ochrogaster TaxID=79684 RepID=A0A8J6GF29_MICOH|nr:Vesicular integral-membrane protein VIP36 [Microtus ochrogaster]
MHVHFKVHGTGKKNLHGDGIALWYTRDRLVPDNHDIISIKLFQLMVERTPEEESIDWTKIEPGVSFLKSPKDNVDDPTGNFRSGPLTGWRVFLLLLCALLGIIVCAVVGAVVFQKRQERNKRFY